MRLSTGSVIPDAMSSNDVPEIRWEGIFDLSGPVIYRPVVVSSVLLQDTPTAIVSKTIGKKSLENSRILLLSIHI